MKKCQPKNLNAKLGTWRSRQFAHSAAVLEIQKDYFASENKGLQLLSLFGRNSRARLKRTFYVKISEEVVCV